MQITFRRFRDQLASSFDAAVRGEPVVIIRQGTGDRPMQTFQLTCTPCMVGMPSLFAVETPAPVVSHPSAIDPRPAKQVQEGAREDKGAVLAGLKAAIVAPPVVPPAAGRPNEGLCTICRTMTTLGQTVPGKGWVFVHPMCAGEQTL